VEVRVTREAHDAVVVGAGPNGLAAAIELARAGLSVHLIEATDRVGGAARSAELTLPGVIHDPASAVYPLGAGSPYLSRLPLEEHGLVWVRPPVEMAHPLDGGRAIALRRSLEDTARDLGPDGSAYLTLLRPLVDAWERLAPSILGPLRPPAEPRAFASFGARAILPAGVIASRWLRGGDAGALLAGSAAHSGLPLSTPGSAAFGLVLHAAGHRVGWPFPRGGAGRLTAAMARYLQRLGGTIELEHTVRSLDELPPSRLVLLDLTPRQVLRVAGDYLPSRYARRLERFRYGAGVFKVDWALTEPIPWSAPGCREAGTVHLGGTLAEVMAAMRAPNDGRVSDRPFVLLSQPSLFDPTRAPAGIHTAWGYCHVPNGYDRSRVEAIEAQVERFAPGFRDTILARAVLSPTGLEKMDANLVGGDVNGGAAGLGQIFSRPVLGLDPYRTPVPGLFLCSASTPPGGGVHGMCGFHSARSALRTLGVEPKPLAGSG
jgi:phytoene dehydrogenase-like protein